MVFSCNLCLQYDREVFTSVKNMVRLFFSNLRRCLLDILPLCIVSFMTLVQSQAGEAKTYNFPKGIVLNSGQYPSSVYGYAHIGNAIVWLDQEGLLFDVKSDYGGHVIL